MRASTMTLGMCGALIGSFAGTAYADRVHLVEGAVIEGKVSRHGDKVVIELESGQLTLPAEAVAKIEDGSSPVERFEQLQAEQSKRGVSGLIVLADFCRDHDMRAREQTLLEQVIAAQPEHAEARARLGYVKGEAGWVKPVVKDDREFEARDRILERERQRAEAKLADQDRQKAALELETQKVALERQKVELELERERLANAKAAEELSTTRYVVNSGPYIDQHHCHHGACEPARRVRRSKPFPIAGVRDPRDTSWPIVGVKDPRSDL
jgi:hypothetical protein